MSEPQLLFVPLGGVGEIGMNLALYGVKEGNRTSWLMVDCGITFAEGASLPGVDVLMPDIRFIEERVRSLVGIVLTHGHEDHIGALLDLWPRLGCDIYATPFTAGLLMAKADEERSAPQLPIRIVAAGGRVKIGGFDVEFLPVAHSIPESHALALRTKAGTIIHTGDWKIDPTPPLGERTELDRFAAVAADGVDALIGDSTNAVRDGRSPSEADVGKVLEALVRSSPARVAVTLFASNIGRIDQIARAGLAAGRSIVVIGRALERNIKVARTIGYLKDLPPFLGQDVYGHLPRENCLALMTGSQGEERSALARVARGEHPHIALSSGDRVIFSSRTIPGNERTVGAIQNGLVNQGIELITDRTHLVHVSGHPRTEEMKELYDIVKPRAVVPVHGEAVHIAQHASLARAWGFECFDRARNGLIVRLAPGPVEIIDKAPSGRLLKDGQLLISENDSPIIPERRRLAFSGVVSVALAVSQKGELMSDPEIAISGVPEFGVSGDDIEDIIIEAANEGFRRLAKGRRRDPAAIEEAIVRAVRSAVNEEWGKKPVCHVLVVMI